jgi:diacylglycerol O-acyltransferase / wax synthase
MVDNQGAHMRESDAFSWYMERDPLLRSTVVSVLLFDRCPDPMILREKAERASRIVPGLRHRIVEAPFRLAPPRWTVDPDFDLSWHVRHVEAPPPKTLAAILDLARVTGMAGFDLARPLWEWTLVDGLEGGRAAVVLKIHHSLTDGIGGMQLAATLFDLEPTASSPEPMPDAPLPEHLSALGMLTDAVSYNVGRFYGFARRRTASALNDAMNAFRHPVETSREATDILRSIARTVRPVTETRSSLMTARKLGWCYDVLEVPLDDLKRAAKATGGTLNDAFVGGVAGGLRRYHQRHAANCEELRVTLPISIRHEDDPAGGNRITLMRFTIPVGIVDPVKRMRAIHDLTSEARSEPSIPLTNAIAGALNMLPRGLVGGMLKHVDFCASNVPGLPMPLYIGQSRMERFYPFGPTIGAAVNVTLLSYQDTCGIGVTTDTGAVPDPEVLMDCLREDFEEILDLGGGHASVIVPSRAS